MKLPTCECGSPYTYSDFPNVSERLTLETLVRRSNSTLWLLNNTPVTAQSQGDKK